MLSILAVLAQSEGLTFGRIVRDIPHDAGAFVVYALIGAFLYLIWRGNRRRPQA